MPEYAPRVVPRPRLMADQEHDRDRDQKFGPMDRRVDAKSRRRRWLLLGSGAALLLVASVALYSRYFLTRSVTVREASVVIAPVRRAVFT
jgi:hypothetical protein